MPVVLGPLVCGQLGMATSSYEDNKHFVLLPPRAALSANDTQPVARDGVVRGRVSGRPLGLLPEKLLFAKTPWTASLLRGWGL